MYYHCPPKVKKTEWTWSYKDGLMTETFSSDNSSISIIYKIIWKDKNNFTSITLKNDNSPNTIGTKSNFSRTTISVDGLPESNVDAKDTYRLCQFCYGSCEMDCEFCGGMGGYNINRYDSDGNYVQEWRECTELRGCINGRGKVRCTHCTKCKN